MKRLKGQISIDFIKITLLLCLLVPGCGDGALLPDSAAKSYPESFNFLDVGINTPYSKRLRKRLKNVLGDDSIQKNNIIDLNINKKTFLNDYFPAFQAINIKLNSPPRERVEHKSIKLMYRYAMGKGVAFNYVEFLFSEYTLEPLMIRVHFQQDYIGVSKMLKQNYGEPRKLSWDKNQTHSESLYWEKNNDLLILSTVPDKIGRPTYQINIYFAERFKDLLETEAALKQAKENPIDKKAF